MHGPQKKIKTAVCLFDFAFFIFNVLTNNRIIFTNNHFLSHCPRIFFSHVEVASSRTGIQAYLNCGWLRHGKSPTDAAEWPH